MWVPVIESALLRDEPARVSYWGTPVVIFRTESGQLGALEDACGHRGIPLSQGSVHGEEIRCGFHHFRFGPDGNCTTIPEVFGADDTFRRRCGVRRFFVREEVGLIWLSVEDEPEAEFPVDLGSLPEERITATGTFDVDGDLRVWLDHFLDAAHCLWTHTESAFSTSIEHAPSFSELSIGIRPDSRYPVRGAVDMTFRVEDDGPQVRYAVPMRILTAVDRIRTWVLTRERTTRLAHMRVRVDLVTPLCQQTTFHVGVDEITVWTAINPLSSDTHQFVYSAVVGRRHRGPVARMFARRLLRDFVNQHLAVEDAHFLAQARYVDEEQLRATDLDATVVAMREIFAAYQHDKAKLYPDGSLMHSLQYGESRP